MKLISETNKPGRCLELWHDEESSTWFVTAVEIDKKGNAVHRFAEQPFKTFELADNFILGYLKDPLPGYGKGPLKSKFIPDYKTVTHVKYFKGNL